MTTQILRITLHVLGLNKFRAHTDAAYAAWSCTALTPMAGSGQGKVGVIQCDLPDASPADTLGLGIDIGYAGQGSVTADLSVLAPADDQDGSDNGSSTSLP